MSHGSLSISRHVDGVCRERVPRRRHVEVFNGNWAEYAANRLERGLGDEVSNFKYRKLVET